MAKLFERFKVIDVDTHVSEPHDVWVDRVPKKWGDKILHVKRDASTGKDHWYIGNEQGIAFWRAVGFEDFSLGMELKAGSLPK